MSASIAIEEPAPKLVSLVHAVGDERIRLHVRGLYRSEALQTALEKTLSRLPQVQAASANPLTGNVLLLLVPGQNRRYVIAEVEKLARVYYQDKPEPARFKSKRKPEPARFESKRRPEPAGAQAERRQPAATARSAFDWFKSPSAVEPSAARPRQNWHVLDARLSMDRLESSPQGLSVDEAARRLRLYGANRLPENKRRSALQVFVEQLFNAPMAMLGVSAVVSVATGGIVDAAVIVSAILLNSVIGYLTESASERTISALGSMTPTRCHVIRDGRRQEVAVEELVVGDLLVLTPGSYIGADARLLSSSRLTVDEAALTGESLPVGKHWEFIALEDTPLADRKNMLHMGTVVTGGSGQALVVATGGDSEIGFIQSLVVSVETPDTLLQQQLADMGRTIVKVTGGLCVLTFGLGMVRGYTWLQMLTSAISLAVAAIPEGLPAVATTTLAIGIRNMRRERVLIRHLPAVESLGSVGVICLDKTGTLTLNKMKVVNLRTALDNVDVADDRFERNGDAFDPRTREESRRLLQVVCLCSEVKFNGGGVRPEMEGSPTECALIDTALAAGEDVRALRARHPLLKTVHRAENRPYMMTIHEAGAGRRLLAVKGSPADVLALCSWCLLDGAPKELDEAGRAAILDQNNRMAGEALRVLGVALVEADAEADLGSSTPLTWLGLIGMEDSIRPGMDQLMARFHEAGVRTVMITGDQSATAYSVGRRLRLSDDGPLEIIDSVNLDKLDAEILKGVIKDTSVFARVSPAHKLKIVQALQEGGRVVAMTGDGVNDGPALKAADIGVAMGGQGTDVARSVADIVLEDDNLQSMIAAIRQGRTIYSNIRKSLRFLLSTNLSEIELMTITLALGWGEALNPLQLLWINMVADIAPALALALEPPERDVLKQPPRDPNQPILSGTDFRRLLRESMFITAGTIAVHGISMRRYGPGLQAGTNTFMAFTLGKLLHALSCRSEETTVLDRQRPHNRYMVAALAGTLGLQLLAALTPQLRTMLRSSPLAVADLPLILLGAGLPFLFNESAKRLSRDRPLPMEMQSHEKNLSVHL